MSTAITPLGARVVAQKQEQKAATSSGIFLPDSAKEKPVAARVVAVGPEAKQVQVGDQIIYKEYSTTELSVDGQDYLVVAEEYILAKLAA